MADYPKIIFLGTGGSRYMTVDQDISTAGIIIKLKDHQIHIDPGPGSAIRAKQYKADIRETDIFLVSHIHIDHCNDINAMIDATHTKYENQKRGVLISTKKLIEKTEDSYPYLTKYHRNILEKTKVLEPGKNIKIGNITIQATKTKHYEPETIGFKIFTEDFVLGYTADTGYFNGIEKQFEKCDILIINNELPFNKKNKYFLSSDDTVKLLKKAKPKLAIITHFNKIMLEKNPIYESREIQKKSGIQTIAAHDGLIIEPSSYSAELKQKQLSSF
jgi:ribonuclease BN (tRNA processing enzyme)